jgi:hypothetical protein
MNWSGTDGRVASGLKRRCRRWTLFLAGRNDLPGMMILESSLLFLFSRCNRAPSFCLSWYVWSAPSAEVPPPHGLASKLGRNLSFLIPRWNGRFGSMRLLYSLGYNFKKNYLNLGYMFLFQKHLNYEFALFFFQHKNYCPCHLTGRV